MDKNEILEKSRKENLLHDEGVIDARKKGEHWGITGFLFLCVLVMTYNLALGLDSNLPFLFFIGYITCESLGRYGARREKLALITGLIGAAGTLLALIAYVMDTLPLLHG